MAMCVLIGSGLAADDRLLTAVETRALARAGCRRARRDEWIRGRLLARAALARVHIHASVDAAADGAPIVRGAPAQVSISHDGPLVAAAAAAGTGARIGVDVCMRSHEARVVRAFRRMSLDRGGVAPIDAWAALECVLKLRRESVGTLLAGAFRLIPDAGGVRVSGLGDAVRVSVRRTPRWVLAWALELP